MKIKSRKSHDAADKLGTSPCMRIVARQHRSSERKARTVGDIWIERDPSGRARCARCGGHLAQGAIRVSKQVKGHRSDKAPNKTPDHAQHCHPHCFPFQAHTNVKMVSGYGLVEDGERDAFLAAVLNGDVSRAGAGSGAGAGAGGRSRSPPSDHAIDLSVLTDSSEDESDDNG